MLLGRVRRAYVRYGRPVLTLGAGVLSVVFLALFACALGTSFYVPLMTDEVSTKVAYAHVFEEHGNAVTLAPMCTKSWVQPIPLPLYPGAVLTTLVWGGLGLFGIRVVGIVLAIVALAGVSWLASTHLRTRSEKLWITAALSAFSCLGVVPFVLVMSRPEQLMKVCLVAFAILPALAQRMARSRVAFVALPFIFLLLASLFFFTHAKALFFLPFLLVAGALVTPARDAIRRRASQALVLGATLVIAFSSYRAFANSTRCDEEPAMGKFLAGLTLAPADLARAPSTFVRTGVRNVLDTPNRAWNEVVFATNNTGWVPLPRKQLPREMSELNDENKPAFVALFAIAPLLLIPALRNRSAVARSRVLLGAALVAGLAGNAFFYNVLPYYNCTLIVPALSLAAALAISSGWRPLVPRPLAIVAVCGLLVLASKNLVALLGHFGPTLVANASRVGPVVPDQPLAVPVFGYDTEAPKIRALARACGIEGDGARHLVIDDYTAFAFSHLRESINMLYVTDVIPLFGKPLAGEKIRPFLQHLESPGVVGRCWLFPKALRPYARRSEDYCCVGASSFRPSQR